MKTRINELLGVEIPVIQAPMGYIARAQLASAVSNAGGLGIVETSSGQLDDVREEFAKMRDLTDKPWGVNIAQMLVHDMEEIVDFVVSQGVKIVTTSAGDPRVLTETLKSAGICVLHVVPTLSGALRAAAAGVDGLVVEGIEGGGFKNQRGASTMVLVPMICAAVDIPVVAAGGICDGTGMAAAFALGAEGVQMGTRMLSAAESPVHDNWKAAVVSAAETDTLLLNRGGRPSYRVLRTATTEALEHEDVAVMPGLENLMKLYFGGEMEASFAFSGQVAGRIDEVMPVHDILRNAWEDCQQRLAELGRSASAGLPSPGLLSQPG